MSKAIEDIKKIAFNIELNGIRCYGNEFKNIIKELERLEAIDQSKPNEALECSLKLYKMVESAGNGNGFSLNEAWEYHNTIKVTLIKTQEQEKKNDEYKKVLEILFKKQVDLGWLWYCIHECVNSLNEYNKKMPIEKFKLTQEEFELLKEVS